MIANTDQVIQFVMIDKNTRVDAGKAFGMTATGIGLRLKKAIKDYINETGASGFTCANCTARQALKLFYYYFDRGAWKLEFQRSTYYHSDLNDNFTAENMEFNQACNKDSLDYISSLSLLFKGVDKKGTK